MAKDWLTDDEMSAEETMRRFAELKPEPTVGPERAVRLQGGTFHFSDLRIGSSLPVDPAAQLMIKR